MDRPPSQLWSSVDLPPDVVAELQTVPNPDVVKMYTSCMVTPTPTPAHPPPAKARPKSTAPRPRRQQSAAAAAQPPQSSPPPKRQSRTDTTGSMRPDLLAQAAAALQSAKNEDLIAAAQRRLLMAHDPPLPYTDRSVPLERVRVPNKVIWCFLRRDQSPAPDSVGWRAWRALATLGRERYTHAECLFFFKGTQRVSNKWETFTVLPEQGSGLFTTNFEYYMAPGWDFYVMEELAVAQVSAMFAFAHREHAHPRREIRVTSATPSVASRGCIAPVVQYTPGCGAMSCGLWTGAGGGTGTQCALLLALMLRDVFRDKYDDLLQGDTCRPDTLLAALQRKAVVTQSVFKVISDE